MRLHQAASGRSARGSWCVRPMFRTGRGPYRSPAVTEVTLADPRPARPRRSARRLTARHRPPPRPGPGRRRAGELRLPRVPLRQDADEAEGRADASRSSSTRSGSRSRSTPTPRASAATPTSPARSSRTTRSSRRRRATPATARSSSSYAESLHGKAVKRGDALAPRCWTCHGGHDVVKVKDPRVAGPPARRSRSSAAGATARARRSSSSTTSRRTGSSRTTPSRSTARAS